VLIVLSISSSVGVNGCGCVGACGALLVFMAEYPWGTAPGTLSNLIKGQ
jgi:hypothetical protein